MTSSAHSSLEHFEESGVPFWARLWDRALFVLLFQDAALSEFVVGGICFAVGLANAIAGSPWGTASGDLWGGALLACFGLPQVLAAIHGSVPARHASNLVGCGAAIMNTLRAAEAHVPVAIVFYGAVTTACAFFILRTDVAIGLDRARKERIHGA